MPSLKAYLENEICLADPSYFRYVDDEMIEKICSFLRPLPGRKFKEILMSLK
jgi:hypothetical protein